MLSRINSCQILFTFRTLKMDMRALEFEMLSHFLFVKSFVFVSTDFTKLWTLLKDFVGIFACHQFGDLDVGKH